MTQKLCAGGFTADSGRSLRRLTNRNRDIRACTDVQEREHRRPGMRSAIVSYYPERECSSKTGHDTSIRCHSVSTDIVEYQYHQVCCSNIDRYHEVYLHIRICVCAVMVRVRCCVQVGIRFASTDTSVGAIIHPRRQHLDKLWLVHRIGRVTVGVQSEPRVSLSSLTANPRAFASACCALDNTSASVGFSPSKPGPSSTKGTLPCLASSILTYICFRSFDPARRGLQNSAHCVWRLIASSVRMT